MNSQPLFSGCHPDDILAWRPSGAISYRQFLAEARWLSDQLPAGNYLLNVCEDRYHFALGFVAGLLTGKISLQPASLSAETLRRIAADYPAASCLSDMTFDASPLPSIAFPEIPVIPPIADAGIPEIPAEQIAAILFTSGSTGQPQPHRKTWGKLVQNARAGAAALGLIGHPHTIVGTVPVQHSYGFESTFLLALHGGCSFWSGKPFFPQDIASALAAVPSPRLLVTTPYHLATLLSADIELPPLDKLLSATAPLSAETAAATEARCTAPVLEIYGSTESGQIACRRTCDGPVWQRLPGVELAQENEQTWAFNGHVEGRIALGDRIELLPEGDFLLHGRNADLINIAGRRTSLSYLNHQITTIPGVQDAVFFLPDEPTDPKQPAESITRLAAFVVAPGLSRQQLMRSLRERIDPIFLPRPLILLASLPRNSTGKLPRNVLQALLDAEQSHA